MVHVHSANPALWPVPACSWPQSSVSHVRYLFIFGQSDLSQQKIDLIQLFLFLAVCNTASTCVECGQRFAKGCGWCRSPSTGSPRCILTTTRTCQTLLTLSSTACHDFFSCSVSASPSLFGANINVNLFMTLKYMGLGSAQYTWNVTAIYRSPTGAIVDTRTVLSTGTRFLPALSPSSSPVDVTWTQSLTIPTHPVGIPNIFVQIAPGVIVLASGRLGFVHWSFRHQFLH